MGDENELVVLVLEVLWRGLQRGCQPFGSTQRQGPGVGDRNRVEVTEAPAKVQGELPGGLACRCNRAPRYEKARSGRSSREPEDCEWYFVEGAHEGSAIG